MTDRTAETAAPCATHDVSCTVTVRARVGEATTAKHLADYVTALIEGCDDKLHEDIRDELCAADICATAKDMRPILDTRPKCRIACVNWFADATICQGCDAAQGVAS